SRRSTPLRFSTAAWDSVWTTIPPATLVAQAGSSLACPSTDTRQIRQLPTIGSFGYQQSVAMSATPPARAASRIVGAGARVPGQVAVRVIVRPALVGEPAVRPDLRGAEHLPAHP